MSWMRIFLLIMIVFICTTLTLIFPKDLMLKYFSWTCKIYLSEVYFIFKYIQYFILQLSILIIVKKNVGLYIYDVQHHI